MIDAFRFSIRLKELFAEESRHVLDDLQNNCFVANGCFDVLHLGHLHLLRHLYEIADDYGARPVVAINSDQSVRNLKGSTRPVVPEECRAKLLTNLRWPFTVVIFDEDTPQRFMDQLRPIAVVKGSEYPSESVIRWSGSEVVTVEMFHGWSTSKIMEGR